MDFPQTLTVEVTADDIARGDRQKCRTCAVALAATRTKSRQAFVTAFGTVLFLGSGESVSAAYGLSDSAFEWMQAFDRGEKVGPCSLDMDRRS